MLETIEMRWFFERVPLDAARHFDRHTEVQERTDWYSTPVNPLCGIKVREGKLEAKLRAQAFGIRDLSPLVGYLESWRKWSLDFPAEEYPQETEMRAVDWLPVAKWRQLQRFQVDADTITPTAVRPLNGCEFEMTRLVLAEREFWTVGFEAVGTRERLADNLQRVAALVVERGGLFEAFTTSNSYGYAQWLSQLDNAAGRT